jgi:hypothetical protein
MNIVLMGFRLHLRRCNATQEYREINDKLLIFIRQYLIKERGSSVDAQTVYQEYENWSNTKEVQGLI